jgi:hypothetical protein
MPMVTLMKQQPGRGGCTDAYKLTPKVWDPNIDNMVITIEPLKILMLRLSLLFHLFWVNMMLRDILIGR